MKTCPACKKELPLTEFWKNNTGRGAKVQSACKSCCKQRHHIYIKTHPEKDHNYKQKDALRLRERVFVQYGNVCGICLFSDTRALQLDHKWGGGLHEKRKIGTQGIYRRALKFPDEYQLLCANHNILKLYREGEHLRRYK